MAATLDEMISYVGCLEDFVPGVKLAQGTLQVFSMLNLNTSGPNPQSTISQFRGKSHSFNTVSLII